MIENIGSEVKEIRKSNNMTLKDLSEKTGLSIGFLSQFERGLTTIAIDSLQVISDALKVDLSRFLLKPKSDEKMILKSYENEVYEVMNNKFINYHLSNSLDKANIYPRRIDILPMSVEEDINEYSHKGEEFVYVIEGILTLMLDSKEYHLYPGDSAHYDSERMHNWANYTNKVVKVLVVSTPNYFKDNKGINEDE
ncbi:helix-turn-helix transcriptional regulator [Clostridium sp. D2Q-14]|uniref:helix-turn-helix domain-containing protein n=1 Tax=Anaeromonas gelatinilytica TaxID=2683194 RepID=UPI00193C1BF8|nr:XRE family transcriptional regulator [Anaeromonas gelatinilytica]MBS4536345.1 helix-turn-helix transcriptional regulator [Anaeromonas gelatinilytica]